MPISRSKSQRKAANRKTLHVNGQRDVLLRAVQDMSVENQMLLKLYKAEYNSKAHLARVLAYVIAANGGELVIPDDKLDQIPAGARLQRYHDAEAKTLRFVTVVDVDDDDDEAEQPKIEVAR